MCTVTSSKQNSANSGSQSLTFARNVRGDNSFYTLYVRTHSETTQTAFVGKLERRVRVSHLELEFTSDDSFEKVMYETRGNGKTMIQPIVPSKTKQPSTVIIMSINQAGARRLFSAGQAKLWPAVFEILRLG